MKFKVPLYNIPLGVLLLSLCLGVSCKEKKKEETMEKKQETYAEGKDYRPNYHFTPKIGWMNDPNGMFFYKGYYHLYFQHYPDDKIWGPMHWGHAISKDMINWSEQPIALYPDELGYIFSGSAVVDHDNTSGFGKDGKIPIVAIFTNHDPQKAKAKKMDVETQGIAYSLDEGLTWTKYEGNPVIANPGARDFRDPKVSWDQERKRWTMVLAAGQEIRFYTSKDLKNWEELSTFGEGIGNHNGVWECPDFFQLPVKGEDQKKWVLLVSINPGGPNGGSATQYFVGDFDGEKFILDQNFEQEMKKDHNFWMDFGKDNYAGVTWSNVETKEGGKLFMGWMSNWLYANQVPTDPWRSAMTVARELKLIKGTNTYRVVSVPANPLMEYRSTKYQKDGISVEGMIKLIDTGKVDLAHAEINFNIPDIGSKSFTFTLSNSLGDKLSFGYDHQDQNFYIDRSESGKTDFSEKFANKISVAPRTSESPDMNGKILLDRTSMELFFDDGETVMTEIFFPQAPFENLSIQSEDENLILDHFEIHELNVN